MTRFLTAGVVLILLGVGSLALGFYRFWCCRAVDPGPFVTGAACLVSGAAVRVIGGLIRGLLRRR